MPRVDEAAAVPGGKLLVSGQLKLVLLDELHAATCTCKTVEFLSNI
jgi:hypothetical protein